MGVPPTRRAFLLGCNSEALAHCERDAKTIGHALNRHGYETACCTSTDIQSCCTDARDAPLSWTPVSIVTQRVRSFLKACNRGDTAVFYFSGHSRYDGLVFNLVVGDNVNDTDHLLNVEDIVGLFKQHDKPAERLLILDCCEASGVVGFRDFWNSRAGTWGRIWVATRTNEHAQELDGETQGGLFTAFIKQALGSAAPALADDQGCLKINRADEFVRNCAKKYHSHSGKPAPRPMVYGGTGEDIVLAEVITSFAPTDLTKLGNLIRQYALEETLEETFLAQLYEDVRMKSGMSAVEDYRGPTEPFNEVGLDGAISNLAKAWYREHQRVKVPLAEFVERIARQVDNASTLRTWLHNALRGPARGEDIDVFIAYLDLGQTEFDEGRELPKAHLAVSLWPRDANMPTQYSVEARLVDAKGHGPSIETPTDLMALAEMPDLLRHALHDKSLFDATRILDRPLMIEFFLPNDLLGIDTDEWTPQYSTRRSSKLNSPLSERYMVTVRALARLPVGAGPDDDQSHEVEPYVANWGFQWNNCKSCHAANGVQNPACCVRLDKPRSSYRSLVRQGACIFILGFTPDREELDRMLRNGLAAILWSSEPLAPDFKKTLIDEVARNYPHEPKQPSFTDLPYALLFLRQQHWEENNCRHTGHFHLLWDDPNRIPSFSGCRVLPGAKHAPPVPGLRLHAPT